jgi:hypothetical protein
MEIPMSHIVEIIRMKMRDGVTEEDVRCASEQAHELFCRMPGLTCRMLLGPDAEGVWTDISEFKDEQSIETAKQLAHQEPGEASAYFNLVDQKSLTYERLPVRTSISADALRKFCLIAQQ